MARPKPAEEQVQILIRLPASKATRLKELAADSRSGDGKEMSPNQYCAAILSEAVDSGITVGETKLYTMSPPLRPTAKVAEDS